MNKSTKLTLTPLQVVLANQDEEYNPKTNTQIIHSAINIWQFTPGYKSDSEKQLREKTLKASQETKARYITKQKIYLYKIIQEKSHFLRLVTRRRRRKWNV
jgi:hypothetical protein